MSGYNYSDVLDGDGYEEQQSGGALRRQLEEALGEIKSLRGELQAKKRGETAEHLLKEKGINPQVAEAIPADVDPREWIDKFGHLFGAGVQTDTPAPPEVQVHDPALDEERAALEQVAQHEASTGIPSTATNDQIEKMKSFQTEGELLAYIANGGVG